MKANITIAQLFLRLALGIGFILPVMDRLGWLGAAGQPSVSWGNWETFVTYTNTLIPFLSRSIANVLAVLATIAEAVFGVLLIIGFKTRLMAIGSFLLTLIFALCMLTFLNYRAPFSYSVFSDSAAALLLTGVAHYKWSIDGLLDKTDK